MSQLNEEQMQRALEVMREYLAVTDEAGRLVTANMEQVDQERADLIAREFGPLLRGYLAGEIPLATFKTRNDGLNKRYEYWGFKGIKGQMFFNMVLNVCADEAEADQELKAAMALPANNDMARSRLKTFISFIKRISGEFVEAGGGRRSCPKAGSSAFFLSYFWQIQAAETWPVYYTNSVNMMTDLNLWRPTEDLAADYITYKQIQEELAKLFSAESGQTFGLYDVEHVFWIRGGNPFGWAKPAASAQAVGESDDAGEVAVSMATGKLTHLPTSYVPPIVSILPLLAQNLPELEAAAAASGTSVPRAFEKHLDAAFTILGYESKLLGQGKGRVPDGIARDHDNSYAIIWDAKVRGAGYSLGTDDRTIREYIATQSRELKRRGAVRNIYYAIISSSFQDDFDESIRELKMETDISEVCLITADALVEVVEAKLRDPLGLSLGSDGLQRLFCHSGIITADTVRTMLG